MEVPPVVDQNGKHSEVDVLEEGETFDPDLFFGELTQQWKSPLSKPYCPRCQVPVVSGSVKAPDVNTAVKRGARAQFPQNFRLTKS